MRSTHPSHCYRVLLLSHTYQKPTHSCYNAVNPIITHRIWLEIPGLWHTCTWLVWRHWTSPLVIVWCSPTTHHPSHHLTKCAYPLSSQSSKSSHVNFFVTCVNSNPWWWWSEWCVMGEGRQGRGLRVEDPQPSILLHHLPLLLAHPHSTFFFLPYKQLFSLELQWWWPLQLLLYTDQI